ncbi:MAG: hypothetical protein RL522_1387 [Pseudomonadota bacterium]|jgi:small-conductance mechanosensitive channel
MNTFENLLRGLAHPNILWEIAVLAASVLIALAVCWGAGRGKGDQSVWFGRGIVDGLLFPLLALVLVYGAMLLLARYQSVALLRIAVPVLVSLAGIRFLARVLTVVFPSSGMARLVERLFSWLAWLGAVLWIVGLLPLVTQEMDSIRFSFGKTRVSLLDLAGGVMSAGAVLVVALWVSAVLERRVLQQTVSDLSLRKVAANTLRATLLLMGLLLALSTVGVDLTALSVLGGALGVGLGFGLQKLAANYVSGFVILFERSLRIGDIVRVDSFEGEVMDIKTRYTLLRAPNGRESIVPNEKLITERVENLSLVDSRILLTSEITVSNDSDVDLVQKVLVDAALSVPRVLRDPAPSARLVRFCPDGLEFSLLYWIDDPVNGQINVRSDTNLQILKGLRAAGIEIPSPQLQVQMRPTPAR